MKEEDIKLGFGDPPSATYIYVGDSGDPDCPWYELDYKNNNKKIPIAHKALIGSIFGLKMIKKTHKGKDSIKLDISIQADKRYVVRTGVETYFSRSFLLAAEKIDNLEEKIILAAIPGKEQSVIFCKVYYAINEELVKADWEPNRKLLPIINGLQSRLNQHPQTVEEVMSGEEHKDHEDDNMTPVERMIAEDPVPSSTPPPNSPEPTQPNPSSTEQQPVSEEPAKVDPLQSAQPGDQQAPSEAQPTILTGDAAAQAENALAAAKPVQAVVEQPTPPVEVPSVDRVPAPIAVSRRTMSAEFYATELDDVINVKQLGELRGLAEQLGTTDNAFCQEVMGCDPSDLSLKGAAHLIHFAGVKIEQAKK